MTTTYTPKSSIKKCPKPQFKSQKLYPINQTPLAQKIIPTPQLQKITHIKQVNIIKP